jgi:hypothetical protein
MMPPVKEPLAGLALLVIFGILIWHNRPIESSPPFDPYSQHETPRIIGNDVYEAWLWKDPFGFDPDAGSGGAFEAQKEWARMVKDNKHPEKTAGQTQKEREKKPGQEPQDLTCQLALKKKISRISAEGRSAEILAPLVKVTPNTVENKEIRTRQRYAVIAGLIESGYQPQEPDRLHFCSIQENSREYDMRWEHYKYGSKDKTEPESEKPGGTSQAKPDIVVAWIDSEILTAEDKFPPGHDCTPSCNYPFKNLLKDLRNKFYLFDLNDILGHDRSEQIRNHIECIRTSRNDKRCVENIQLIKPAGIGEKKPQTKGGNDKNADPAKLKSTRSEKKCEEPAKKPKPEQCDGNETREETGSKKLAGLLGAELTLRGIKEPSEEVIIILENASKNAGTLASNIGKHFSKQDRLKQDGAEQQCNQGSGKQAEPGKPTSGNSSGTAKVGEIRNVFYLKSSDGNPKKTRSRDKKDKNENQSDDKTEHVAVIDLNQPPPLPLGPGQMDYFHRLAEEIGNVHDTVDFEKRDSGAKAVVILGSDFNDKLLIIEALRDKLPHLLILTTDLDARMLYPKHWRSTRNLVVASHFDLLLQEKTKNDKNREAENKNKNEDDKTRFWQRAVQAQFPPFRDSHQTNIFYRTLAIAEGNLCSIDQSEKTFPGIFEVGRNGFVRLGDARNSATEKNDNLDNCDLGRTVSALKSQGDAENNSTKKTDTSDYHPSDSTQKNTKDHLWLLFGIAIFLIWFHWAIRPWSNILSLYLLLGPLTVLIIALAFGMDDLGEPLSFTDGVSLWPTIFIQIIAVLLAVALFIRAICELERNFCCLSRQYFRNRLPPFTVCPNENEPDECGPWLEKRLCSLGSWLRDSSVRGWWAFSILIWSVVVYARNDVDPQGFSFLQCFVLLFLSTIIYIPFAWEGDWEDISIKHWREKDNRSAREMGHNGYALERCSVLRRVCSFFRESNRLASPPDQVDYESTLWGEYRVLGWVGYRLARVVAMWLIFAIIETLLAYLLPPWPSPCRGSTCGWASWTGVMSFTLIMLLLFFVLDAVRLNFYWIKKLRRQHPLLKERITQEDVNAYNHAAGPRSAESLEKIVSMVATRTQAVDRLIYYPMFCIMLLLFAKITYFDNQDLPLSKALTFGVAISVLFFSGFMLRHEANRLKLSIKKEVQDLGKKYAREKTAKQIVKRIDEIDEGAFQPMFEQPVMQALLLILTSLGLFASEYIKLFG